MNATERFLKYVSYPTNSNEESESCPSTEMQLTLAHDIGEELLKIGLFDVTVTENGYVYATLQKTEGIDCESIGFIAHLDTSPAAPCENIKTKITLYTGNDIELSEGIYLREKDFPALKKYKGQHLITTDGTTLLGADDKAGVAEIITALEYIISNNIPHGKISVAFTPDEEIGRGADLFDVEKFGADYAYTIDGGALGEIEYENFNAAGAVVTVNGISIHPGSALGKMKNASTVAMEFNSLLPIDETPECTSGYEGFYHLTKMSGEVEYATLQYIIRDHDREKFEKRKEFFLSVSHKINEKYGEGTVSVNITDQYYNMREKIEPCMYIIERAKSAFESLSVKPNITPIRGGTDGARLSFMGLPCPNLSTGGENFHARTEYIATESLEKMTEVIVKLCSDLVK